MRARHGWAATCLALAFAGLGLDVARAASVGHPSAGVAGDDEPEELPTPVVVPTLLTPPAVAEVSGALPKDRPGVRFIAERWTIPATTLAAVRAVEAAPLGRRMEAASHDFLNLPYLNEADGEADADDPDPPSRYDAFDCLTFVEEVLGLSLAGDPLYAPTIRDALRYRDAAPRPEWTRKYQQRRHFMEAEWLPDGVADGLLEDITDRVGPARTLGHDVTAAMWKGWAHARIFHLPPELFPTGHWSLQYLDLATALTYAKNVPAGAIVLTVRSARAARPIAISHVSLMVQDESGKIHMRHASRMGSQKVRDDDLVTYIHHVASYGWACIGLSIYMPREQGPRVSALTAASLPPPFPPATGPVGSVVPLP